MNCTNCGKDLPNDTDFCICCGAPQKNISESLESDVSGINTSDTGDILGSTDTDPDGHERSIKDTETPAGNVYEAEKTRDDDSGSSFDSGSRPKKKSPLLKVLAVVIAVAVLIPSLTVLAYHTFLPAKATLAVAGLLNSNKIFDRISEYLTNYENKNIDPLYADSFAKNVEISLSADEGSLSGLESSELGYLAEGINSLSFTCDTASDIKSRKQTVSLGVNILDNPFLSLNMFLDNTRFGFSIPELSSKTITGDFKNLSKLSETFPEIPRELTETYESMDPWSFARIHDEISFDRDELKKINKDYSRLIIKNIDPGDMSIRRGQETQVLGRTLNCQEITIELDRESQAKIITSLLAKLENDDRTYEYFIGNFNKIIDIMGETYGNMLSELGAERYLSRDGFRDAIETLKDSIDVDGFPEKITAKLYINGFDIVKCEYIFGAEEVRLTVEQITSGSSFEAEYTLAGNETESMKLSFSGDHDKASDTYDLNASMDISFEEGNASFILRSEETPASGNSVDHDFNAEFAYQDNASQEGARFGIDMSGNRARNSKKLVTQSSYNGKMDIEIFGDYRDPVNISLGFGAKTNTEYGKAVELPHLDGSNTLDISTAGQSEYEDLLYEIYQNIYPLIMSMN